MKLLDYTITPDFLQFPPVGKTIINTINPHSFCIAKKDMEFQKALYESDYLFPDGIGIVWAAKVLNRRKIQKIAGFDVFMHLMLELNKTGGRCFFLGASTDTLELITERGALDFPNVHIASYSPPYKPKFTEEDSSFMCAKVNVAQPDVLFVGMTAPKQEKWVQKHKEQLNATIICSIGAVFDFYAGTVKRPSIFWIKMGLEWLPRFLKEPRRLAKRNLVSTPRFVSVVMRERVKRRREIKDSA